MKIKLFILVFAGFTGLLFSHTVFNPWHVAELPDKFNGAWGKVVPYEDDKCSLEIRDKRITLYIDGQAVWYHIIDVELSLFDIYYITAENELREGHMTQFRLSMSEDGKQMSAMTRWGPDRPYSLASWIKAVDLFKLNGS